MKMTGQLAVDSPEAYIEKLAEPRKSDVAQLHKLIRMTVPKLKPFISSGMLAYGPFHYRSRTGREGDWFRIGVASNKQYISLYACGADERGYVAERYKKRLPKASIGKSCVRFKKLADVDVEELKALLKETEKTGWDLANW
jgi:hypothetical protein